MLREHFCTWGATNKTPYFSESLNSQQLLFPLVFPSNHQDKDKKEVDRGSYLFSKQIGICEKRELGLKSELGLKGGSPWGSGWKEEKSGV